MTRDRRDFLIAYGILIAAILIVLAALWLLLPETKAQDTPPAPPSGLAARAGPGRSICWNMVWDFEAGMGPDSITVDIYRKRPGPSEPWLLYLADQTPQQLNCVIETKGEWPCWMHGQDAMCGGPRWRCCFNVYRDGAEPDKDYFYGGYFCDRPGGVKTCFPSPPRAPIAESHVACYDNAGQGCYTDGWPVDAPPPPTGGLP